MNIIFVISDEESIELSSNCRFLKNGIRVSTFNAVISFYEQTFEDVSTLMLQEFWRFHDKQYKGQDQIR